jgi:O-antigen/teichoic acid export membrane protein
MITTVREQELVAKEIKTAVRHSTVYGLGGVLVKVAAFFMLPFYTHYLNPADYGILEILDLSMSLFGMLLNMGMTAAMLRCYAGANSAEGKQEAASTAFLFAAATGFIVFLVMLAPMRPISNLIFGPAVPSSYLLLSFASFILNYVANLPFTYLRALEASGTFVAVETGSICLMLSLNIYFIAVLKMGLVGILVSSLIVAGLRVVLLSAWMLRQVKVRFSAPLLRQMVRFGLPLIFSNMALFAMNFSDRFFLQHLRSLEIVGIYAVGYKFGFLMNYLLVQPFYAMWQSRMYIVHARPDHPKIFSQLFVLYSLLLTYAGLALSMLSSEIVKIMVGPKFAASGEVVPIVVLAYVFYGVGYYVQLGIFLTNNTKLLGIISSIAAVLNLVLNYFLILHYGMMGAAWATLVSFAAIAVGSYVFSHRVFPLSLGVGRVSVALAIAICFYLLSRWLTPSALWAVVSMKVLLLGAFPVLLWKFQIVSGAQVEALDSMGSKALAGISRLLTWGRA